MEDFDHVAARVTIAATIGGLMGGSIATYRGHNIPKMASSMAASWALTATACLGTQRVASAVMARSPLLGKQDETSDGVIVASHGIGGIAGGGLLGYLYIRKPVRGMIFMTLVMLMVALAEIRYHEKRRMDPSKIETIAPTRTVDGGLVDNTVRPNFQPQQGPGSGDVNGKK